MFDLKTTSFIALTFFLSIHAQSAYAQAFCMGQQTSIEVNTGAMAAGGSGASPTGYVSQPSNPKAAAKFAAQQAAFNASLANMTPAQKAVAIAAHQAQIAAKRAAAEAAATAKSNAAVAAQRAATGNIFGPFDPNGFQPPSFIAADQDVPPPIGVSLWADGYGGDN